MSSLILRTAIHTLFAFTGRKRVSQRCLQLAEEYGALAERVTNETGKLPVKVPKMPGIDVDMRNWSFFDVLEHNTIVNKTITATVCQLAQNQKLSGAARIDPKRDVLPAGMADESIREAFLESIHAHNRQVAQLGKLRGTKSSPHPLFGDFDAHKWNCMFAFHLKLHLAQAKYIVANLQAER